MLNKLCLPKFPRHPSSINLLVEPLLPCTLSTSIQSIRDDVDANLGAGEWARLLPALCEGRLVPTVWLNKVHMPRHWPASRVILQS